MSFSKRAPGEGIVNFTAEATITDGAVVVQGAADDKCALPAAVTDAAILGLAKCEGGSTVASGLGVDVVTDGVYPAKASGSITRGDRVCIANTSGDVKTAMYGVVACRIVGYALESAATGERVAVLVMPGAMPNLKIEQFTADGAVTANTIVIVGSADNKVAKSGANPTIGVVGVALNSVADGATVYVCTGGVVPITSQGNLTRGAYVTSGDASGGAKVSAPGAGTNAAIVGIAVAATTAPAAGNVLVSPGVMQG